jgi:hypothetical protein
MGAGGDYPNETAHITPILAAGAAAVAIAAAPTASAESTASHITNPSTTVPSEVVPVGFNSGGYNEFEGHANGLGPPSVRLLRNLARIFAVHSRSMADRARYNR